MLKNIPIKTQRLKVWIKHYLTICYLLETHFKYNNIGNCKLTGQKNIYHANSNKKKAGVAILISEKVDTRQINLLATEIDIIK